MKNIVALIVCIPLLVSGAAWAEPLIGEEITPATTVLMEEALKQPSLRKYELPLTPENCWFYPEDGVRTRVIGISQEFGILAEIEHGIRNDHIGGPCHDESLVWLPLEAERGVFDKSYEERYGKYERMSNQALRELRNRKKNEVERLLAETKQSLSIEQSGMRLNQELKRLKDAGVHRIDEGYGSCTINP